MCQYASNYVAQRMQIHCTPLCAFAHDDRYAIEKNMHACHHSQLCSANAQCIFEWSELLNNLDGHFLKSAINSHKDQALYAGTQKK